MLQSAMSSVAFVARSQLRGRWRSLAALALAIGVVGGISVSLIAGARRSSSVVRRYFAHSTHYDVGVYAPQLTRAQIRSLPGARIARRSVYLGMARSRADGSVSGGINGIASDVEDLDPTFEVLSGRVPRVTEPFSGMVNESFVKQYGLRTGDDVDVQMFAERDANDVEKGVYHPHGPHYRFRIVGVYRSQDDVALNEVHGVGQSAYDSANELVVPFAFYSGHHREFLNFGSGSDGGFFDVQFDQPSNAARFTTALKKLDASAQVVPPSTETRRASMNTPVDFESAVLLALGLAIAIAAAVVVALLLRAEQRAHARDDPTLRALGMTRVDLGTSAALRVVPVAALGALLATALAIALSGRYPIGVGGELELDRGRDVNVAVLGAAVGVVLLVVVGIAFLFGWLGGSHRRPRPNRATLARWFARSGAPADVVVGTHLAFERGRSEASMPSRPAVAGGAAALAVIAAVGVFVSGVDHLYRTPSAHGWPFDIAIGNVNFGMPARTFHQVESDPRLATHTAANYGQATLGGKSVEVLAIADTNAPPAVVLTGRLPQSASEVALGPRLLDKLHTAVGAKVSFSVADSEFHPGPHPKTVELSVVGTALAPIFGESEIGEVAVIPLAAVAASGGDAAPRFVLARVKGDRVATTNALRRDLTPEMATDAIPSRVVNLHRVRDLPLLGVALAALLGLVLLAYTMAVGVRARTRGLGLLRALGMSSRRLGRVLTWQGVILAAAMLVIGLPVGVLLGSVAWRAISHQIGVADNAIVPIWIVLLAPAAIAAGVLASLLPARRLRRKDVAALLRAE
jgi:hypothetical protein